MLSEVRQLLETNNDQVENAIVPPMKNVISQVQEANEARTSENWVLGEKWLDNLSGTDQTSDIFQSTEVVQDFQNPKNMALMSEETASLREIPEFGNLDDGLLEQMVDLEEFLPASEMVTGSNDMEAADNHGIDFVREDDESEYGAEAATEHLATPFVLQKYVQADKEFKKKAQLLARSDNQFRQTSVETQFSLFLKVAIECASGHVRRSLTQASIGKFLLGEKE